MDAYSIDLRERVASDCDAGKLSQPQIAEKYQVSVSFITRLLRRRRKTASLAAKPHTGGYLPTFDERDLKRIVAKVRLRSDITLAELCAWAPKRVSDSTMSRILIAQGLTQKKVAPRRRAGHTAGEATASRVLGASGEDRAASSCIRR